MTHELHHLPKLGQPYVSGEDCIREGVCSECGVTVEVHYGEAGAFVRIEGRLKEVSFEEEQ